MRQMEGNGAKRKVKLSTEVTLSKDSQMRETKTYKNVFLLK